MNPDLFINLKSKTPEIPLERNYWLVRTMGGDYYDDFLKGNYIAIGYDEISIKDIKYSLSFKEGAQKKLSELVDEKANLTEEEINSAYAAAQILKFANQIKENDVVIVPGKSEEKYVSIGIVDSEIYEKSEFKQSEKCTFKKRINVKWTFHTTRFELNPEMYLMFNSRHIISNINDYAEFIDCTYIDYFKKDNKTFIVLRVKNKEEVNSLDLMFINDVIELAKEYSTENSLNLDLNELKIKICVQSPGDITLFSHISEIIALIGLLTILLNGGGLKLEKYGFDLSTPGLPGLIKSVSEFLDRRKDRLLKETVRKKLENLEIDDPQTLLEIIKEIKNPRDSY